MRALGLSAAFCMLTVQLCFAQDKATIEKLNEGFMAALQEGDVAAIGRMYAEDAYLLPSGGEMVKGRAAIQAYWTKAKESIRDLRLTTVDVKALGSETAREIGTFILHTKGQAPQELAGKYVVIWRRVDGDWKLETDIWNTDK